MVSLKHRLIEKMYPFIDDQGSPSQHLV